MIKILLFILFILAQLHFYNIADNKGISPKNAYFLGVIETLVYTLLLTLLN